MFTVITLITKITGVGFMYPVLEFNSFRAAGLKGKRSDGELNRVN